MKEWQTYLPSYVSAIGTLNTMPKSTILSTIAFTSEWREAKATLCSWL
jgi:hypothetical protein